MTYLRNAWYLAAWADELPVASVLTRRLLDEPVAMFRDDAGAPKAVLDRCPHRFAPLSRGRLDAGTLVCGYHGLGFNGAGACVLNPHGPILKGMAVRSFPVQEAFRGVWIWMGDPALAAAAPQPELGFVATTPDSAFSRGYMCGNGNYQLFVDNILDLSHIDYLHADTLGGGAITQTRPQIMDRPGGIGVHWHSFDVPPSPLAAKLRTSHARVDSWTEVEWTAPAVMTLTSGSVPAGTPRGHVGNFRNLHIMTPETERSTHYFYASTRDYALDDIELTRRFGDARDHIFATEDKPMIDAQQDRMGSAAFWDLKPMLLNIDQAAVKVRRRIEEMVQQEIRSYAATG